MAGRILVLDDEENFAEMLKDLLSSHHYLVDVATRPERAMHLIEEIPYDLVISDYKMPVMDGSDFLKKARELYPKLPFILVSGLMNTPELVKVANMSVTLVMEKPLNTEVFLGHVARFTNPVSEEEQAALGESQQSGVDMYANLPEPPRFVAAASSSMQLALEKAMAVLSKGSVLYLLDPGAGDAELVARDLSRWLGNEDRPVACLEMAATAEEALNRLKTARGESGNSDCLFVRLGSDVQLSHAEALTERAQRELQTAGPMRLIFSLAARPNPARLSSQVAAASVTLPALVDRPLDLASYVARFMKIAGVRAGQEAPATLTPEAVFEVLAFDWPEGYPQVQSVITRAVESVDPGQSIELTHIQELTGMRAPGVEPGQRLATLLQHAQRQFLAEQLQATHGDTAPLVEGLGLKDPVPSAEALLAMPLIDGSLAKL